MKLKALVLNQLSYEDMVQILLGWWEYWVNGGDYVENQWTVSCHVRHFLIN